MFEKQTIHIPMIGGLGNQLFQLAFGLKLSTAIGVNVKYAFLGPEKWSRKDLTTRAFLIEDLVQESELSPVTIRSLALRRCASKFLTNLWVSETTFGEDVLNKITGQTRVVQGYFQDYRTVESVKAELTVRLSNSSKLSKVITQHPVNRVAVHLRYGDYLSNSIVRKFHGLTDISYYVSSVISLLNELSLNEVIIVSDDKTRATQEFSKNFYLKGVKISTDVTATEAEDFVALAISKGIVMSNSTFSWWASWIAEFQHGARIICPSPWFSNPQTQVAGLLPKSWTVTERTYS